MRKTPALKPFPDYTDRDWALVEKKDPCALVSRGVSMHGVYFRPTQVADDGDNIFALRHSHPSTVQKVVEAHLPFEIVDTGKSTVRVRVTDDWLQAARDRKPFSIGGGTSLKLAQPEPDEDDTYDSEGKISGYESEDADFPENEEMGYLPGGERHLREVETDIDTDDDGDTPDEISTSEVEDTAVPPSDENTPIDSVGTAPCGCPSVKQPLGDGQGDDNSAPVTEEVQHTAKSMRFKLTDTGLDELDREIERRLADGWTEHARTHITKMESPHVLLVTFVKRESVAILPVPDTEASTPDEDPDGEETPAEDLSPTATTVSDPKPSNTIDLNAPWEANALRRATSSLFTSPFKQEAALQPLLREDGIPADATLSQAIEIVRHHITASVGGTPALSVSDTEKPLAPIKRLRVHVKDLAAGDVIQVRSAAPENRIRHFTILEIGDGDESHDGWLRPATVQYRDEDTPRDRNFATQTVIPYFDVVAGPHLEAANHDRSCTTRCGLGFNWALNHPLPQTEAVA